MRNVRIAIIDTGISHNAECARNVSESYVLSQEEGAYVMLPTKTDDYIGHGTAVATIVYSVCQDIEFVSINICRNHTEVEECGLTHALEFIHQNCCVDIVNISAGITNISDSQRMQDICDKLQASGILIISAFDNNRAISYPAAYKSVIGIDVTSEYANKDDIYKIEKMLGSKEFLKTLRPSI